MVCQVKMFYGVRQIYSDKDFYMLYIKYRMKKRNGFTLIELLVVIAIMSILTMITVSQFTTARKKARDVSRKSDLNSVSKAVGMYYTDYGFFPIYNNPTTGFDFEWGGQLLGDGYVYMKTLPKENLSNWRQYCYVMDPIKKSYAIFAALENTSDADCVGHKYMHCGDKEYCYEAGENGVSFKMFAELENKNNPDCKEDGLLCGGVKYCYTDIIYVNKTTE